ncbi:uncharacterized protein LOC106462725 isoform X3 [Limulus polyphemus]|uniref:Uncharacterized protein LOC106462725 isoform X3 n=1 Tax=Limulus polyphemus TaxID=6850 RepID=A0ABM1SQ56_LIMPO|nr:uncharacterized protein LOC106462725 isoform X3 [Limulus polyphemus]XP_022245763.1 uncharacterized protein LOC106462725 isoform X3 [Limulus polyphemus]
MAGKSSERSSADSPAMVHESVSSMRSGQVNGMFVFYRSPNDANSAYKHPTGTASPSAVVTSGYQYIEDLNRNCLPHSTVAQVPVSLYPALHVYREPYLNERSNVPIDQHVHNVRRRPTLLPPAEPPSAIERLQAQRAQREAHRYQYEREMAASMPSGFVPPGNLLAGSNIGPSGVDFDHSVVSKRPRLAVEIKHPFHQPLIIDTLGAMEVKKEQIYNPQVEAISPTLPGEDSRISLSPQRTSKDELLQSINKIDREIAQVEHQVTNLRKKQLELEAEASQPSDTRKKPQEALVSESKQLSIAQLIYSDNRKKAQKAHGLLEHLGPSIHLPLYNQPSDIAVYHENKRSFTSLKKKLLNYLMKTQQERQLRDTYLTENYTKLMQAWLKKMEKRESSGNRKVKETKQREFFEKQFPELRKQREDKERFSRVGQRVRSEAELEEIVDGIHEQELEDKKMKSYAVIPPILLDQRQRRIKFLNNNGFVEDPMAEYQQRQLLNMWTDHEKEIFREKYLQHPKNFVFIASYLERKSVNDCVQYYYLSKKSENYKQLLRKHTVRKRTRPLVKPPSHGQPSTQPPVTFVTTTATLALTAAGRNLEMSTTSLDTTTSNSTVDSGNKNQEGTGGMNGVVSIPDGQTVEIVKGILRTGDSSELQSNETAKDLGDNNNFQSKTSELKTCAVCRIVIDNLSQSQPLTKSNCDLFGLKENYISPDMRICSSCQFKSVRRRCPIPTCKTLKRKLKRLRSFPSKWKDVPQELRDLIIAELEIPNGVQRCCCGCFNRIAWKLGVSLGSEGDNQHGKWNNEEIKLLKQGLREFGMDWDSIAKVVTTKTSEQCKSFYMSCKEKLGVEELVKGETQIDGEEITGGKLVEDSGETTSSCEEDNCIDRCSSDTASAPSPVSRNREDGIISEEIVSTLQGITRSDDQTEKNLNITIIRDNRQLSQDSVKNSSDYDSSATMSADEGLGQIESEMPGMSKQCPEVRQISEESVEPEDHIPLMKTLPSNPAVSYVMPNPAFPIATSTNFIPVEKVSSKEEPTCVRDLIYQAIEYSLQAPNKSSRTCTPVPVIPSSKDSCVSEEVKEEESEAHAPSASHETTKFPMYSNSVPLPHAEGLAMMAQFSQALLQEQDEVQDLSKKDRRERINISTQDFKKKERISPPTQLSLGSGLPHHQIPYSQYGAPPPAHSNQYNRSLQPPPDIPPPDLCRDVYIGYPGRLGFVGSDQALSQPPRLITQALSPSPTSVPSSRQVSRPSVPPPPPLITNNKQISVKFPHMAPGSITQGTPVSLYPPPNVPVNPTHYEGLVRQIHPKQAKNGGSITLGTPLHDQVEKRPVRSDDQTASSVLSVPVVEGRNNRRTPSTELLSKTTVPVLYEQVVDQYYCRPTSSPYDSSQSPSNRQGFVSETSSSKQLMIDFNTSKQMHRETSKVPSPRARDSSPHPQQDSRIPQTYASMSYPAYSSASEVRYTNNSSSLMTHRDQPLSHSSENQWTSHRKQSGLHISHALVEQSPSRHNVIRSITWGTGKPSVIQIPKSSSSCIQQSISPIPASGTKTLSSRNPHHTVYPVMAPTHDAFNTLVDAAVAQPSLAVPKEDRRPDLSRSPQNKTIMEGLQKSLMEMQQHPRSHSESRTLGSQHLQELCRIDSEQGCTSSRAHVNDERQFQEQTRVRDTFIPEDYKNVADKNFIQHKAEREQRSNHKLPTSLHLMQEPFTQEKFEQELMNARYGREHKKGIPQKKDDLRQVLPIDVERGEEGSFHLGRVQHQADLGREAARILSESFQKEKPNIRPTNNQFTAVHLIDAIITRQISQNADTEPRNHNSENRFVQYSGGSDIRPRTTKEAPKNEKVVTIDEVSATDRFGRTDTQRAISHGQNIPLVSELTHVFTLKQQIEDIISKNYNCSNNESVSTSSPLPSKYTEGGKNTVVSNFPSKGTCHFVVNPNKTNFPSVDPHYSVASVSRHAEGIASAAETCGPPMGEPDHTAEECPGSRCVHHSWKLRKALQSEKGHSTHDSASMGTSPVLNHDEREIIRVTHEASPPSHTLTKTPNFQQGFPLTSYTVEPISPPTQKTETSNESGGENVLGSSLGALSQNFTWSPSASIAGMFASRRGYLQQPQVSGRISHQNQMNLSPLDYVKNKIVEVMKTESTEVQSQKLCSQSTTNENLKFPSTQHNMNEENNALERPRSNGHCMALQDPLSSQNEVTYGSSIIPTSRPSSAIEIGSSQTVKNISRGLKRSFDTAGLGESHITRPRSVSPSSSNLGIGNGDELGKRFRINSRYIPESSTDGVIQQLPESSERPSQEVPRLSSSEDFAESKGFVTESCTSPNIVSDSGTLDSGPQSSQQDDRVPGVESSTDDIRNEGQQWEVTSGNTDDRLLPDVSSQLIDSPGSGEMVIDESSNVNSASSSRIEPVSPPPQEGISTSGRIEGLEEAPSSTSSELAQNSFVTSSLGHSNQASTSLASSSARGCYSPYGPSASVSSSTVGGSSPGPSSSLMPSGTAPFPAFTGVTTTYTYPFSALTVRPVGYSENSPSSVPNTVSGTTVGYPANPSTACGPSFSVIANSSSSNSPTSRSCDSHHVSLLSSQYEPLSDED